MSNSKYSQRSPNTACGARLAILLLHCCAMHASAQLVEEPFVDPAVGSIRVTVRRAAFFSPAAERASKQ
jgi:hypothetical protein